ncbi:MAG TPA: hypothetical protein ENI70_01585 [Candidatus Peregrinibacteria bacterium]|nr:hypothetical protein [Candidatus Peregrinibacteria bacterium]
MAEKLDKNSVLYWYPKIKDLPIPMPKTVIWRIPKKYYPKIWWEEGIVRKMLKENEDEIKKTARKVGYPLFLRTDQASGKHGWERTCYVESEDVLLDHAYNVIEFNMIADLLGLPFKALVFREFIEMDWKFKAFHGNLPIPPERRYFIKDGKVVEHFPYWIEDAIAKGISRNLPENWRELLAEMNRETEEEVKLLTKYAEMVAKRIDGYWSIDFCRAKDGTWYLIDMAAGEDSWKPDIKPKSAMEYPDSLKKVFEKRFGDLKEWF